MTSHSPKPRLVGYEYMMHLAVTLKGFRSAIWRTVEVPTIISLDSLHDILQIAMGWTDAHLYAFEVSGQTYRSPDDEPEFEGEDWPRLRR